MIGYDTAILSNSELYSRKCHVDIAAVSVAYTTQLLYVYDLLIR